MKTLSPWQERRPERRLLAMCLGLIGLGFILVLGALHGTGKPLGLAILLPYLLYGLCLVVLHLSLVLAGFRGDQLLGVALAFLAGLGLLAQIRLGAFDPDAGGEVRLHAYAFVGGFLILVAVAWGCMGGRYRLLATGHWPWFWAGLSLALVILLLATGQRFRGAVFGAGLITPTELLKVSFILFVAAYIDREAKALANGWLFHGLIPPWRPLLPLAGVFGVLMLLLLFQRDLGMVLILGLCLPLLLSLGTGRWGYLGYGLIGAGLLGGLLLGVFEHGERRIQAWLAPFQDPTGDGWQILQGLSGMYAGGLWGEGFGAGNPEYTPIAESDFIYAVIGEELGFAGTALLVAFFLLLLLRGMWISAHSRSGFGLLLGIGLTLVLTIQTFLNIGGLTLFIPLTGTTLPFISQGGSSLVTTFVMLGLLLAISDGEPGGRRGEAAGSGPKAASGASGRSGGPRGASRSGSPRPGRGPGSGRRPPTPAPPAASPGWRGDDRGSRA